MIHRSNKKFRVLGLDLLYFSYRTAQHNTVLVQPVGCDGKLHWSPAYERRGLKAACWFQVEYFFRFQSGIFERFLRALAVTLFTRQAAQGC